MLYYSNINPICFCFYVFLFLFNFCVFNLFFIGQVRLTVLAYAGKDVVKGTDVVYSLRHQVLSESPDLLDLPLLSVDTVVCQNDCSGNARFYVR